MNYNSSKAHPYGATVIVTTFDASNRLQRVIWLSMRVFTPETVLSPSRRVNVRRGRDYYSPTVLLAKANFLIAKTDFEIISYNELIKKSTAA